MNEQNGCLSNDAHDTTQFTTQLADSQSGFVQKRAQT